jgi:hypothetical protein
MIFTSIILFNPWVQNIFFLETNQSTGDVTLGVARYVETTMA